LPVAFVEHSGLTEYDTLGANILYRFFSQLRFKKKARRGSGDGGDGADGSATGRRGAPAGLESWPVRMAPLIMHSP